MARALGGEPVPNRAVLRARLADGKPLEGLTGTLRVLPHGAIERELTVLTIREHTIAPWQGKVTRAEVRR